jgi:hypothetical protein
MSKITFKKSVFTLSLVFLLLACEKKFDGKDVRSEATVDEVKSVEVSKVKIKPDCLSPIGSAMEEGEVTVCYYNTDSLALAYLTIVKDHASNDDFGYALLKKTLPDKDLEDNFDDKQTWIKYKWSDKGRVKITIQMAGGEDTLEFAKEKSKVKLTSTLSAD